ncbi:MAG: type III-B CRISPR module-associated Cmr3 family protein [bacterium]
MRIFAFEPVDTWFFRDGAPYSIDTGPQLDVGGSFPPSPFVMAGAMRAALATARGWDGTGRWPREFNATLGDGPDNLGCLSLKGPFLIHKGELLFPAPRHLWTREDRLGFALPGGEMICDLGLRIRMPRVPDRAAVVSRRWVRRTIFEAILNGQLPAGKDLGKDPWLEEARTGIQRDPTTRTVRESMLYSSRHFRLRKHTALLVSVDGLPADWPLPNSLCPFGGESRMAYCQEWAGSPTVLTLRMPLEQICADGRFVLIALTPLDLDRAVCLGQTPLADLGGARVVAACMDRPLRIGGWDSLSRQPRPMRSYVPPGTVFFCECADRGALRAALERIRDGMPPPSIGGGSNYGFGCVALGTWVEEKERQ